MINRPVDRIKTEAHATPDLMQVPERKIAFDYLRSFAVTLVLYHHAIIAYTAFAFINFDNPIATGSPVVNAQRWLGFDLVVAFNETFFMPLLFFISGIFAFQSLTRKGARKYIEGRLIRLGIPFGIGVLFIIPFAYYPAQLQVGPITGVTLSYREFWFGMIRSGFGTAGPLWFLWLLLLFDGVVTFLYRTVPFFLERIIGRLTLLLDRPFAFWGALLGISMAAYVPMAVIIGPLEWIGTGPFHAQAGRILLYLVYFLTGMVLGACGFDHKVFRSEGAFARHWWVFLSAGLVFFIIFIIMIVMVSPNDRTLVSEMAFVVCCGFTVFGMTGFFLRHAKRRVRIFDSLSDNGFGIYIVHYVFVTWLQYILLRNPLNPLVKSSLVFLCTLNLSWVLVAVIRRIPLVAKII